METDHILRLLQKCLSEGQPEDWQQLRKELARGGQEQVQKELFLLGELKPEDLKADPEKLWRQIAACRAEGENRKFRLTKRWRYLAAEVLLFITIGVGYLLRQQKQPVLPSLSALLEPGERKAILKFENGEQIDLGRVASGTLLSRQGVTICLDSLQGITYLPAFSGESEPVYNTIEVPRGGEYRLVLPDGSMVWLNSDSELKFPMNFAGERRKVFLKGEAYFEVVKNPDMPFIVEVAAMEVKVLGTCCNINASRSDERIQTTLVSGKVEVSDRENARKVVLLPNQRAELKKGCLTVENVDAEEIIAWMQGKFYFESESLEEIATQLERWYDIHFFFSRESLKQEEFTGVIRRDYTANRILEIITKTTNVEFDIKGRTVTVY